MDSSLIIILANAGTAGVVLVLLILGILTPKAVVTDLKAENAELKAALAAERERANTAVAAAQSAQQIMAALQAGIELGTGRRKA